MQISKREFLETIDAVRPALTGKGIVESFTKIIFSGKDMVTYNGRILIVHPFETDFDTCISVSVDHLQKTIKKIPPKARMTLSENHLKIRSRKINAKISVEKDVELPDIQIPKINSRKWRKLPEDFMDGLKLCCTSVHPDQNDILSSIAFTEHGRLLSSDDARVSCYQTKEEVKYKSFLLPGLSALDLLNYKPVKYNVDEGETGWIFFLTDKDTVFCSLKTNKAWPVELTSNMDFRGTFFQLPDRIKQAVESALIMAEAEFDIDRIINVKIEDGFITCIGEGDMGRIEAKEKISNEKKVEFDINPIFFSSILDHSTSVKVGNDRALFKSGPFKHLIALAV